MDKLTHLDDQGASRMVDVGDKPATRRTAVASGSVRMQVQTLAAITGGGVAKGNVLEVARLAGIMAAKRTSELIPLCHPLPLELVEIQLEPADAETLGILAKVQTTAKTGVEMEALTAVSAAALTVYDMCKSIDRSMAITDIQLELKTGGASGDYAR